ncbi:MAG: cell wall-binding repeat-containing protein [Acidimicrobiaceae bacterium]|nr:cell wall-binding repeat-containing protein [Acidimicrobiaceae bacterium]
MTTTKMRRGKRSLAAILAAMLVASVLAVVAGSPAQAANTSYEVKLDTNADGVPDAREFAGQDRYETALRLAKSFATARGGRDTVPTAFLSSGETLVDSISAAGLAGLLDAPILLTQSDSLHRGVADFIEDYGVTTVHVLGGSAAVSDAVLTAVEGLQTKPKATRVSGVDRYATAAAAAGLIDVASNWCGTSAKSALLINGATDMISYGVAAQTIAYRLQLPLLMTAADKLPDATADFVRDNDIEHVQIIGGTDVVSAAVASALSSAGVDTVSRVDGSTASEVSVKLAEHAWNGCGDDLGLVSRTHVALVRGNPDGVVAAPVLASSLDGGNLVVPLIVGGSEAAASLPASVRDWLAGTPVTIPGMTTKLNLGIVAIGGPAAISDAVMGQALMAASSAGGDLAVTIAGRWDDTSTTAVNEGDTNGDGKADENDPVRPGTMLTLHFNGTVDAGDTSGTAAEQAANAALLGKLRDVIYVNDAPAGVASIAQGASPSGACSDTVVNVTLSQAMRNGDTVSVEGSRLFFGTGGDRRTVARASAPVRNAPADTTAPQITVIGIAGQDLDGSGADWIIRVTDDRGNFNPTTPAAAEIIAAEELEFLPATGASEATALAVSVIGTRAAKSVTFGVSVSRPAVSNVVTSDVLAAGDRLVVKRAAVADAAGNPNAAIPGRRAIKPQVSPIMTTVQMSELRHMAQATWTVPSALVGGTTGATRAMTITAKKGGPADGAAGNDWTMLFDRASTYSASKPLDIDVRVEPTGKRVTVRFNNGPLTATLGDLVAALKANPDFDSRFTTSIGTTCADAVAGPREQLGLVTTATARDQAVPSSGAGLSQFAIEVRFNGFLQTAVADQLLDDVLAGSLTRVRRAYPGTTLAELRAAADATLPTATVRNSGLSLTAAGTQLFTAPSTMVRYEGATDNIAFLPRSGDLVDVSAGIGARRVCTALSLPAIANPVAAAATGYSADLPRIAGGTGDNAAGGACDRVDESMNGASERRIGVSSAVKARHN